MSRRQVPPPWTLTDEQRQAIGTVFAMGGSIVWPFEAAPRDMQERSQNGGDEDWITIGPVGGRLDVFGASWLDGTGCCDVAEYEHEGWKMWIGCHS